MRRAASLVVLGSWVSACSASGHVAAESSCDPLAARPTTLATVLGVGKDTAGTIYVADEGSIAADPSIVRVFVAGATSLVRQHVIGSGFSNGEDLETFESPDGSTPPRDLVIQVVGGEATTMTLGPEGSGKAGLEGMDAGAATLLTLVDPSAVAGMPVTDLPGAVRYVADGSDGKAIVVTEPLEDDVAPAGFRLFYGQPGAMVERPITSFEQSLSGYPTFGFAVGALTYVMAISSIPSEGALLEAPGPVTVTGDGVSISFMLRLPTPSTVTDFTFTCPEP
jgi:hypothetical protein